MQCTSSETNRANDLIGNRGKTTERQSVQWISSDKFDILKWKCDLSIFQSIYWFWNSVLEPLNFWILFEIQMEITYYLYSKLEIWNCMIRKITTTTEHLTCSNYFLQIFDKLFDVCLGQCEYDVQCKQQKSSRCKEKCFGIFTEIRCLKYEENEWWHKEE